MIIGKEFTFEAAHFIPGHDKCGEMHGHTYRVTLELQGPVLDDGMIMDFHDLSVVKELLVKQYDHIALNLFFRIPSVENITELLYIDITSLLPKGITIHSLKVQEGEGGYAKITS
jgi:6-pyruvoyltetrahydropterin/6-carboxytetrahydropterin synthase